MMTTAAKMAFHLKDLGWRGSGDAVVIVFVFCVLCSFVCQRQQQEMREERLPTLITGVHSRWHPKAEILGSLSSSSPWRGFCEF